MLKIERVQINGFKSFCDPTEVRFTEGITAVVGPNGCGKSNIGDAIHWVLGEQSARTLRGGKMEDVIFAGTESRGPHGMAEVSLHFHATNGDLPGGDPSAIVTRRLFRSGDSEYLINGRKVRLRDIQEMLHAARVGATTYAVIEQGKVDSILSAKPRERRFLIEEAAGIIGYKQKRRLAELKLEATQANLLRIHDVVLEVRRQINALKRQAARARRYSRVRDELRAIEGRIFAARARFLEAEGERVRAALADVNLREAGAAASLALCESELEALRQSRRELESRTGSVREAEHGLAREIDREEATIRTEAERAEQASQEAARLAAESDGTAQRREAQRVLRDARAGALAAIDEEIAAIERTLASLSAEESELRACCETFASVIESRRAEQFAAGSRLAELSNTIGHLEKESNRLAAQRARLAEEKAAAESEAASLEERSSAARMAEAAAEATSGEARAAAEEARGMVRRLDEQVRALAETVSGRREAVARLEERVRSLEDVENRLAGIGSGARWLLTRSAGGPVRGVVADFLRVSPESEGAVEGYLGPFLAAVVVPSSESAVSLVQDLRAESAGRCLFVPEGPEDDDAAPATGRALPTELAAEPAVLGSLAAQASTTNGIGSLLARRLAGAILVRDLESAIDLARRRPGHDFVTPSGDVVSRDGTIEGGRGGGSEDGLLARRRLLETARSERDLAASALTEGERSRSAAGAEASEGSRRLFSCERALQEAEKARALASERAGGLAAELERAVRRAELLREEIAAAQEESGQTAERLAATSLEKEVHEQQIEQLARSIQTERAEFDRLQAEAALRVERLAEHRSARAAVRERRAHTADEVGRLETEMASLSARIEEAALRRAEAEARSAAAMEAARLARERLAQRLSEHAAARQELAGLEETILASEASATELEEESRARREHLDVLREERRGIEVAVAGAESEWRHLGERCRELLDEEVSSLLTRIPEEPEVDLSGLDAEASTLRSRLEAIGPVNLLAIEEFRELEERQEFLLKQEKDLNDSIESLKETIRRINRTSRELFVEAFELVRTNFNETFKLLFGGGRADIRLMEDEDPLECGLEISVQPPGKRLQSLSLLSGGERALAAIALLFAIFRYQPSPFCLLDEVDAALDESNVRRFTRMLKEFEGETQFIVITHNKRSMEAANTLYGVTMEEPGISRIVSMNLS